MAARPLFILGRHRSGTTWLANILASLPEVYALTHERHRGVHESAYFSHLVPFCGNGRTAAEAREIKRLFERSDFFALSGLGVGPDIARLGIAGYFREVMEAGAARRGARYWLEKTPANTPLAGRLRAAFPDGVFLAVVRDYRAVVASMVHGFGDPRSPAAWIRQSAITAVYEKLVARSGAAVIRYESLVSDYDATVRSILALLGITADPLPTSAFGHNSLYAEYAPAVAAWQALAMAAGRWLVLPWPAWLVERVAQRRAERGRGGLPAWFFPPGAEASLNSQP